MIPWKGIYVIIYLSEITECIMPKMNHKTMDAESCDSDASLMVQNAQFWWGMFIMGQAINVWEQRYMASIFHLLNFVDNLKLL